MKHFSRALCVVLLAVPAIGVAKDEIGCDSVNWGEEVLAKFPNAARGCHDVTMKNGEAYAHYVAKVVAKDSESMTVNLIDKDGKAFSEVKFVPNPEQAVTIDGKKTKYMDLDRDTKLDLYIQHSRWGLYSDPASSPMKILSRKDL